MSLHCGYQLTLIQVWGSKGSQANPPPRAEPLPQEAMTKLRRRGWIS